MQTIVRHVGDIAAPDRQGLEQTLGQSSSGEPPQLPSWCQVYAGLSAEEIGDLENVILTRADLSRSGE